uniref:NACHT, LRR and PYD domains-containing protein 3-like n=1 Tax=Poecilia formosa TaxID=48698 RepID=A0A096M7W5_POEFO
MRRTISSPTPSVVSLKSNDSMDYPVNFKRSSFSGFQSNDSMDYPVNFKSSSSPGHFYSSPSFCQSKMRNSSTPSVVSLKSNDSMDYPVNFKAKKEDKVKAERGDQTATINLHERAEEAASDVNSQLPETPLDILLQNLEGNIVVFVENELRSFHKLLNRETVHSQDEDEEVINWEEEEQKKVTKEAFLDMIVTFLRRMKQEELAFALLNKSVMSKCQSKLKSNLKMRLAYVLEGIAKEGHPTLLNKIYTDLYITEGREEVICDHEVKHFEKALKKRVKPLTIRREELFKPITGRDKPVRTVMTEGVAGIGKTVLTQKFALDWAEGKNNQDIQFTFPFSFRGLNMVKEKKFSLVELIHLFFPEIKEAGICRFDHFRVLFIFDGLDECRFALDLKTKEVLTDVTQSASLEVLLANLIKGRLLPSARVWITTRPAAAHLIPPEFVDLMTEVRGFNDPQKEEYFRKRFTEEEESKMVLSHIKSSRSLYIMCHIPVFCWVIATVLEDAINAREQADLPNSLTDMYILFLVVLSKVKNVKYDKNVEKDPLWTPETRDMIQSLGKLAFEQLMKGNLFFYESDLTECGIDVRAASVYSGCSVKIVKGPRPSQDQNMFCFVHLSIQEFLAALHVHLTFINTGVNLLAGEELAPTESVSPGSKITEEQYEHFYQNAVDKTVNSNNGHLDLFLRFLLGLSLKTNQRLLQGFSPDSEPPSCPIQSIAQYIKKRMENIPCPVDKANFFHCLNELKELSLVKEIEQTLKSGKLETEKLTTAQRGALFHVILYTEGYEDSFDVRKYLVSDEAQEYFKPLLINSTKVVLSCCFLNATGYGLLGQILSMNCCFVKDLDLSNNDMEDSGLMLLCKGISNRICRLETLRLVRCNIQCLITKEGCAVLASALASNPFYLKELDLSYNHPEEHGVESLSAGLENPKWALQTLRVEPSGLQYLKPGLKKYAVELVLDTTTAHRNLTLSDCNKKVTVGQEEKQPCSANPEKFDVVEQLLCRDRLTGRCYWEVEWRGKVSIGVAYKGIRRRGESKRCGLGMNDQSWALFCSKEGFFVLHNNKNTEVYVEPSNKVGVYLDWPGGTLTFFRVSPDKMTFLHSFNTKFTEPVYPAFRIEADPVNSSL